jgi:acetyl-CoA carboxylase carboxyltransferase component
MAQSGQTEDIQFNKTQDEHKLALDHIENVRQQMEAGGGEKKAQKQKEKGKLLARERIAYLLDDDAEALEIGAFAGYQMYQEHGGCPAGGVVVKIGKIHGRQCIVVANDATVKAGAWFPMTAKKNLRAQEIALENRIPIIYLVDSAGVYLPMQDEIFADKDHFGRIFRNNAVMSSEGIQQIAAIMGSCVAGGAYLPIMSDEAMIVEDTGSIFLAGPYLVKAAIGEDVSAEELGGATTQSEISGVTDNKYPDDESCLNAIRSTMAKTGHQPKAGFDRTEPQAPAKDPEALMGHLPFDRSKPYDTMEIIERLVDNSDFQPFKEGYGKTMVCGYARIDGWAVGIVANQRQVVKSKKGEMQVGGVIYSDGADKAARFVMNCNQKHIPLVFLQDVTGFMVGSRAEQGGIIKDGAKLVSAVSNSVVPKFTVIMGNSYGAGNYAMCGKAYDPRLIVAWPSAHIAVMGGSQAAKTLTQIKVSQMKAQGEEPDKEKEQELEEKVKAEYEEQTKPLYAAARLWVDDIIDPRNTRKVLSQGLEAANHAPVNKQFNPGVIQT